jgi:hypothetical protein
MDPLTITATSISLAFKAGSLAQEIYKFVNNVRSARYHMDCVAQELGSLKMALEMMAEDAKTPNITIPMAIGNILKNVEEVLGRLEKTLEKYNQDREVVRVKYVWSGKETMIDQKNSLSAHRDALNLAIDLMTM